MKHRITKNWGLKLVSFLFAAMLWIIVTNINDPVSPLEIENIPVTIKHADLITDKGQIYEVLENTDRVDVLIRAPRSIIDTLDVSNVIAEADMNDLTNVDTIPIKLSTNKYNDKLESIRGNIDSVKLNIENKQTRSFPIRANVTGEVKEGYMVGNVSTEQNLIRVSGPQSVISQIARAQADVDVSAAFTGNIGTDSDIRLYNEDGVEIRSQSIEKNISKVRVNVEILEKKSVPIVYRASGTPADGFRMTGEITGSRNNVTIAGKSETMRNIGSIDIPETAVDVTDAQETVETVIDLNDYLPEGVRMVEDDFEGKVTVSVQIEQERRQTVYIQVDDIQMTGVPAGYTAVITEPEERYGIVLVGLASELSEIDVNTIETYVDVAAWLAEQESTEPESGYYRMPLAVRLPENTAVTWENVWVNVHITESE